MARKDKNALLKMNSASNHSKTEREENDFYATPTRMVGELLQHESFGPDIWEPCNGMGHISDWFKDNKDIHVYKSDIIDRTGDTEILDFFGFDFSEKPEWLKPIINNCTITADIITNPPYSKGTEFYEHACQLLGYGRKLAIFVKIQFLETQKRYELFKKFPPKSVLICVNRVHCGKDGKFNNEMASGGAACYCWLIYEKGYTGKCIIDWINKQ